jgi:hypothetical protein
MAIMPTNSASDASAAASWITALNMVLSLERSENIVHVMFFCQAWRWPLSTSCRKQWFLLVPVIMPVSVLSFGRASEARPTKRPPALLRACRVFFRPPWCWSDQKGQFTINAATPKTPNVIAVIT